LESSLGYLTRPCVKGKKKKTVLQDQISSSFYYHRYVWQVPKPVMTLAPIPSHLPTFPKPAVVLPPIEAACTVTFLGAWEPSFLGGPVVAKKRRKEKLSHIQGTYQLQQS
jgi:hypothetical protein